MVLHLQSQDPAKGCPEVSFRIDLAPIPPHHTAPKPGHGMGKGAHGSGEPGLVNLTHGGEGNKAVTIIAQVFGG